MGNSSNKKELNMGLEKIIVKTLTNFPKKDLQNLNFLASKLFFHQLLLMIRSDKECERRDIKNMQLAFKELESFANLIYEQKENISFFGQENQKFKETLNLLIKKLKTCSYSVEISGKNIECIDSLIEEINVSLKFFFCS